MKRILFIITILSVLVPHTLWANDKDNASQHAIKGKVVDEAGHALPGASVRITGTTLGTGTNAKGEFSIKAKEGKYTLVVSFTGYTTREYNIAVPQNSVLTCELQPSYNNLNEVVVTGTRTEKPLKDVPVLTRVITNEQIVKLNPVNLQTVLEYELPGIQFGRHHGTGLTTMTFQGTEGNYVLFLIDGERVGGEGAADNTDFDRFNIDDIERIEVIKGAASTLYGSNALGGVINIITKNANRPFVGNVSGQYSNRNIEKYVVSAGTKLDRFSSYTTVGYRKKDAFQVSDSEGTKTIYERPDGTTEVVTDATSATSISGHEIWHANQKFGYVFTDKFSAELTGSLYQNRMINADKSAKTQSRFNDYTLNTKLNYIFNVNHRLDFSYYMDDFVKYTDYTVSDRSKDKTFDNFNHIFRLNYTGHFFEKHTVTAGAEINLESLKHYMFEDTTKHNVKSYVLYLQEDWRITDNFSLVAGVRADYHSRYDLHVTPKLSLMYKLSDFTFRGGYASGFRSPSLKELYSEWNHQGMFYLVGNEALKPETSHHFSLSSEYTKGIFNASVSAYYNRFSDKITTTGSQNEEKKRYEMMYVNANKARTTGIDATAQLRFKSGLNLRGSYAYVNDHKNVEGYNTSNVRPHSVTCNVGYSRTIGKVHPSLSFQGRWMNSVNAWNKQTDGTFYYRKYHSRTICSLNGSALFPRGIRLNAGLNNLFNFKDKNVASDTSISPEQGIDFTCGLSINLADMFKL
jgi:outer membrane receptor for ferrienterochelin and colicins